MPFSALARLVPAIRFVFRAVGTARVRVGGLQRVGASAVWRPLEASGGLVSLWGPNGAAFRGEEFEGTVAALAASSNGGRDVGGPG